MNNTNYENPFSSFYLAEQFVRETKETISKRLFSTEIFNISEVGALITESMNHFVIGVPGSGKTMALAFLRSECLSIFNRSEAYKNDLSSVWSKIPPGLWGIYHGLLLNEEFLSPKDFQGFGLDEETWGHLFADFLNSIFLKILLKDLCTAIDQPEGDISTWLGLSGKKEQINIAIKCFSENLGLPKECFTASGLRDWVQTRLQKFQKLTHERIKPKINKNEIPSPLFKEVGALPIQLVHSLKMKHVLRPEQKVFFILDEYDQCYSAKKLSFGRKINDFVKSAARGPVKEVYLKIGTRPYGFYEKRVYGGDAKIEEGRDYKEINLPEIFRKRDKVFSNLITDIANRRLQNIDWFAQKNLTDIKCMLEDLSPLEEAKHYQKEKSKKSAHFSGLEFYCKIRSEEKHFLALKKYILDLVKNPIHQKYLVIIACRELKKGVGSAVKNKRKSIASIKKELNKIGKFINSGKTVKQDSRTFYKLKDLREPSLFLLASEYKQQKYYCGFEDVKLMSEGIPLTFIKLCREIFNEISYKSEEFRKSGKISFVWQNRAIRNVSEEFRKESRTTLNCGHQFLLLLDELGFLFRKVQLDPCAPYPTPNGVSIEKELEWLIEDFSEMENVAMDKKLISLKNTLREAVDWGFLIAQTHRSKMGSLKTRTKYYINSLLSPYYDLSIRHLKEPIYIQSLEHLIDLASFDENVRSKTRKGLIEKIPHEKFKRQETKQLLMFPK